MLYEVRPLLVRSVDALVMSCMESLRQIAMLVNKSARTGYQADAPIPVSSMTARSPQGPPFTPHSPFVSVTIDRIPGVAFRRIRSSRSPRCVTRARGGRYRLTIFRGRSGSSASLSSGGFTESQARWHIGGRGSIVATQLTVLRYHRIQSQ